MKSLMELTANDGAFLTLFLDGWQDADRTSLPHPHSLVLSQIAIKMQCRNMVALAGLACAPVGKPARAVSSGQPRSAMMSFAQGSTAPSSRGTLAWFGPSLEPEFQLDGAFRPPGASNSHRVMAWLLALIYADLPDARAQVRWQWTVKRMIDLGPQFLVFWAQRQLHLIQPGPH
jgi:hypothetical protein